VAAAVLGEERVTQWSGGAWKRGMPQAGKKLLPNELKNAGTGDPVVYYAACAGRIFGANHEGEPTQPEVIATLLERAGYAMRLPAQIDQLCCGKMMESKGMAEEADAMAEAVAQALLAAADDGRGGHYPVIMDASTCTLRMQKHLVGRLTVLDFHQFAADALLPRLRLHRQPGPIALHINCSVRLAGTEAPLRQLLKACVDEVIEPAGVNCCGFGGDRGFVVPELNAHALRKLHQGLPAGCSQGVSTNRTCEIGLSAETGRPYRSIAYLLEECSRPEANESC
jgi:D-lactate dehydrogenase